MSITISYTCDRCGDNVTTKGQLRYFTAELDLDVDKKSAGAREPIALYVCHPCGSMLLSVLRSAIETRGTV